MKIKQNRIFEVVPGCALFPVILLVGSDSVIWRDLLWGSILVAVALLGLLLAVVGLLEKKKEWALLPTVVYTAAHLISLVAVTFVLMRICILPYLPQVGEYYR